MAIFSSGKRRFIRIEPEKHLPIRVDINGKNFIEVLDAKNISNGGVSLYVPHAFQGCELDDEVSLVVTLPQPVKQSVSARGKIKHVSQKNFGVVFSPLPKRELKKIKDYIFYRLQKKPWGEKMKYQIQCLLL